MHDETLLTAGNLTVGICPAAGGSISRFFWKNETTTIDLMRPADRSAMVDALTGDPRGMASFPLVPFSGRVANGKYSYKGRDIQLVPNFLPEPHAIHGDGWKMMWAVNSVTASSMELICDHEDTKNGISYSAAQRFSVRNDALVVEMTITNTGDAEFPVGLGMHPAFIKTPLAKLTAGVSGIWLSDETHLPTVDTEVSDEWNFTEGRVMSDVVIDNNFSRWDRQAKIEWPEWDVSLLIESTPTFGKLVVYCPSGQDFFCVEPVSNVADGFNLKHRGVKNTGVHDLAPEQTFAGGASFTVSV